MGFPVVELELALNYVCTNYLLSTGFLITSFLFILKGLAAHCEPKYLYESTVLCQNTIVIKKKISLYIPKYVKCVYTVGYVSSNDRIIGLIKSVIFAFCASE